MSAKRVKIGVVGVGSLGRHHARIYSESSKVDFVGVYDSNPKRAKTITSEYGGQAFVSLDEFSRNVVAASVAVPTHLHREVAGQLLEQGLHLMVEKPIAGTTAEAEELVALAQKKNVILQVGHVERFNPVLTFLEKSAEDPRFIEAHRLAPYPPPREGLPPRGTEVSVVLDLMIHDLEVVLHIVQSPVSEIRAVGVPVLSSSEDIANVRLLFENGCVANITASRISPERMRKIRVFLNDAYLSLDYQNQSGDIFYRTAKGIVSENVPIKKGEPLALELQAFVESVAGHDEPVVTGAHTAEALNLAVKIMQLIHNNSKAT